VNVTVYYTHAYSLLGAGRHRVSEYKLESLGGLGLPFVSHKIVFTSVREESTQLSPLSVLCSVYLFIVYLTMLSVVANNEL
jgi:hypothetical protein